MTVELALKVATMTDAELWRSPLCDTPGIDSHLQRQARLCGLRAEACTVLAEEVERMRSRLALDELEAHVGKLATVNKELRAQLATVEAERDASRVIVAQLQDFVTRERALRDAVGKGGQHVNGYAPSINPSVLKELERMLRDAPEYVKGYTALEADRDALRRRMGEIHAIAADRSRSVGYELWSVVQELSRPTTGDAT